MKRMIAGLLILALTLISAGAPAETPVRMMYDSVFNLLFDTNNVTLTGHAEFSLDGERFKTADARYVQDGVNSLWDWKLKSPRRDGSERESGYTVIANGEKVYVMEVFYPGMYKTGSYTAEHRNPLYISADDADPGIRRRHKIMPLPLFLSVGILQRGLDNVIVLFSYVYLRIQTPQCHIQDILWDIINYLFKPRHITQLLQQFLYSVIFRENVFFHMIYSLFFSTSAGVNLFSLLTRSVLMIKYKTRITIYATI